MRKSRFSDEQMVAILREADRTSVAEVYKFGNSPTVGSSERMSLLR